MGKINTGRESKKRNHNSVNLPAMEILKPLMSELITITDSPINSPKLRVKKYVSPLSLSWKRQVPNKDSNEVSSATESAGSRKSPKELASVSQAPTIASSSSSSAPATSVEINETHKLGEDAVDSEHELKNADLNTTPKANTEAAAGDFETRQSNKKKMKRKSGNPTVTENALEDSSASCIGESVPNVEVKEISPSGLKKRKCSPEYDTSKQLSAGIEIIDLDMTNDSVQNLHNDVEFISYKKLPLPDIVDVDVIKKRKDRKKPVTFVDLSCTSDGLGCGSSNNDSVIVIDDVSCASQKGKASVQTSQNQKNAFGHGNVSPVTVVEVINRNKTDRDTSGVLFKIKPNHVIEKKKNKRKGKRKRGPQNDRVRDDICFLGTGISNRPPIPTNFNVANSAPTFPHHQGLPESSAQQSQPPMIPQTSGSIYGSNFDNPNGNTPQTGLRPIVIDGSNVAMGHGKTGKVFSSRGIEICVNYFLKRGHKVYCFIPLFRKSDPLTKDRHILEELEKQGHLICTPSRFVGNNTITPYDDRYIVQIAAELGGIIVSRDNFRDLIHENPAFKETILTRSLMYTWVGDIIMFPTDPFGRCKVTLEQMLRF